MTGPSRVALVTGAARGIGAATVDALCLRGYHVVAVDSCAADRYEPQLGYELATPEELNDWYEYAQDLLVIPPPGKPSPAVNPEKDKQLAKGVEQLRDVLKASGKAPKG